MTTAVKKQFKVFIEFDEDGYYVASVPALPGCHTQAKTLPELKKRTKTAIQLCLSVARTNSSYRNRIKRYAYEPMFVGMELVKA